MYLYCIDDENSPEYTLLVKQKIIKKFASSAWKCRYQDRLSRQPIPERPIPTEEASSIRTLFLSTLQPVQAASPAWLQRSAHTLTLLNSERICRMRLIERSTSHEEDIPSGRNRSQIGTVSARWHAKRSHGNTWRTIATNAKTGSEVSFGRSNEALV